MEENRKISPEKMFELTRARIAFFLEMKRRRVLAFQELMIFHGLAITQKCQIEKRQIWEFARGSTSPLNTGAELSRLHKVFK